MLSKVMPMQAEDLTSVPGISINTQRKSTVVCACDPTDCHYWRLLGLAGQSVCILTCTHTCTHTIIKIETQRLACDSAL